MSTPGNAPQPTPTPRCADPWYLWWPRRMVPTIAVVYFIVVAFPFFRSGLASDWYQCFVRAAQRMQQGEPIHHLEPSAYAYPPAMAMFSIPLAQLPTGWSMVAWYAVNVAAAIVAFVCVWRLAGGPGLMYLPGRWPATFALTLLLAGRFFTSPLENQQFDMVIAATLMAGCLSLARRRGIAGGVLMGLAAGMKCTPLLFAPYLLWRRQWAACALLLVTAVSVNLLPDFLWPQSNGRSYAMDWRRTFLSHVGNHAPGQWHTDMCLNQSLAGFYNRLIVTGPVFSAEAIPAAVQHVDPTATQHLRMLTYGTGLLLLAVTVYFVGAPFRAASELPSPTADGGPLPRDTTQTGLEAAAIVSLMLLLSPMSGKSHYVVMLLPMLLVARWLVESPSFVMGGLLALLLATGPLTAQDIAGDELGDLLLYWGAPTIHVGVALAATWWMLADRRRHAAPADDQTPADHPPAGADQRPTPPHWAGRRRAAEAKPSARR